jgi:integrase/recombinase XerD
MNTINTSIKEFIGHCTFEKNLSQKTIKFYTIDLMQFKKFLIERKYPIEVEKVSKFELRKYLEEIAHLKPKSIKRKIATLKAMFNYLEFEDKITSNPFRKMRIKIKEEKNLPKVMDIAEIEKIFKIAYKDTNLIKDKDTYLYFESVRNIVVIELLFSTGARVSEIANIRAENLNLSSGVLLIKGKGNKERIIQICNEESLKILNEYSHLFKDKIISSGGFFLVNRFGAKLSDQSIRTIVKNIAIKAGVNKHITPHIFRHSLATLLLEEDVDIRFIQKILGHSSIMTTQIYTHVNKEKQKQILIAKHPRKDVIIYHC